MSFGHDVRDNAAKKAVSKSGLPDECPGKFPSPWAGGNGDGSRPRTRLTEAMERARRHERKPKTVQAESEAADDEEAWEDEDLDVDPDITVDLNEPHSRSGKYWKSEFQRYQEEAKVEMDKLVKYKQLAKSYAKMKDAESMDLNQKLKEEKDKVVGMERRITELAGKIARKRMKGTDQDNEEMIRDLTRQTALAVQYRNQVKELEAIMKNGGTPDEAGGKHRPAASPRTHKTLLETQRELRRAREQVKQLGELKDEVRQLKAALRAAQQRERAAESNSRRLEGDLTRANSKLQQLEERVRLAEDETRQKHKDLRDLQREHDALVAGSEGKPKGAHAEPLLRRRSEQISDMKKNTKLSRDEKEVWSGQDYSSKDKEEEPWKQGLVELQTKLKAEQDKRTRKREGLRTQFESTIPSSPITEVLDILPRRDLRSKDHKAPAAVNILEDDDTALELPARKKDASLSRVPSTGSRHVEKRASSAVLSDRTTGNSVVAERKSSAALRLSREDGRRRTEAPRIPSHEIEDLSTDIWAHIAPEPAHTRSTLAERGTPAAQARSAFRPMSSDSESPKIDLLQGRFARLGGPDVNSSTAWTVSSSKSTLPPDRRAAALARLEQKKAERERVHGNPSHNKENVRPW